MGSPTDENDWRNASEVQHRVAFTNDYSLAIYETTRRQFALMGCSVHATYGAQETPFDGDDPDQAPIGRILYDNLRGAVADGIVWPATGSNVGGYLATIRAATGLDFDIPTEAQWEWRMPLSNDQLQILLAVHTAHLLGSLHEKGLT